MLDYTALVACDPIYFREHAPAYIQSCVDTGTQFVIVVLDCDSEESKVIPNLVAAKSSGLGTSVIIERTVHDFPSRTRYSQARFMCASKIQTLLAESGKTSSNLLITDIDCMFMKPIPKPDKPVGLYLREPLPGTIGWEKEGTRVAAGLVYVEHSEVGNQFINQAAYMMRTLPQQWFVDQVALSRAAILNDLEKRDLVHKFTQEDMDWQFTSESRIWTGKGDRKYSDLKYVTKRRELEEKFRCAS